jgi:uncharacterized protein with HEPN domain
LKKADYVYLKHIADSISKIEEYTLGLTVKEFERNSLVQDAVIRQIEIIGEASKQVSPEFRKKHSQVPWKDIAGMRDKLIHDYLGVDIQAVWATVCKDLPELKGQVKVILNSL